MSDGSVCEVCGADTEYDSEMILCKRCEEGDVSNTWVATVHILVACRSQSDAADAFSGLLTEAIYDPNSCVVDWGYVRVFGKLLSPSSHGLVNLDTYKEGDFLEEI
jgi:hypothetical protein